MIRATTGAGTLLAMKTSAYSMSRGIMKTNVKTSRPSTSGATTCRIT